MKTLRPYHPAEFSAGDRAKQSAIRLLSFYHTPLSFDNLNTLSLPHTYDRGSCIPKGSMVSSSQPETKKG